VLCKLEKFSFYTSSDTSIWICVLFTLDRFVAVCFPLRRRTAVSRPSRAKYFAAGALVAAVGKNLHVMWTRGPEFNARPPSTDSGWTTMTPEDLVLVLVRVCGSPTPGYRWFETYVRPWIAFSVISALPFCVIVVCNVFIVHALVRYTRYHSPPEHCKILLSYTENEPNTVTLIYPLGLSSS